MRISLFQHIAPRHAACLWSLLLAFSLAAPGFAQEVTDPPVSNGIDDYSVLEDAAQTIISLFSTFDDAEDSDDALIFSIQQNTNPGLLSLTIDDDAGTLSVAYVLNQNGAGTVTVRATDTDGLFTDETFTVTVDAVNDAPNFTVGANPTVNEDTGAQTAVGWATSISAGPANESAQVVSFAVTGNTNPGLFSAPPSVASDGTLTYTPAANQFGSSTITLVLSDDGGTANGGVNQSAAKTFTITVNNVNDEPSFTGGANQTVNEDAGAQTVFNWASNISAGANEGSQTLTFNVSAVNTSLFSVQPAISSTGTLTYTPAPNASGASTVTVSLMDDGGTANGGDNESPSQSFTVTVNAVNDPPTTSGIADITVNEDAGNGSVNLFASFDDVEDADAAMTYQVLSNTNPGLFTSVTINASAGTLTLDYAPDANGTSTITVRATDTGGLFVDEPFTVTVNAVNDEPSFTKGSDVTVTEDASLQTVPGWATNLSAGPANESAQTLTFNVTASNTALFSTQPAISSAGALTFQPAPNASGTATMTVTLQDNGGTANGGDDTSPAQTFVITVTAVNDAPTTSGIAAVTDLEDAVNRVVDLFSAFADAEDADNQLTYTLFGNTNPALFASTPAINGAAGTLTLDYAANASGSSVLTIRATDTGGLFVDASFTVQVTAVNDAPSFVKGPDVTLPEDAPPQAVTAWATAISAGPADEALQTLTFVVTNNNNALFAVQPSISVDGTLSFTLAPEKDGAAVVTVLLQDNGGTANGGVNTSPETTFIITATPTNDPPVAVDDEYIVLEGQSLIASAGGSPPGVLDNDLDADGDNLTATVVQAPRHASTWSFNTNGSFVYVHDGSENVTDSLKYVASDGTTNSNVATVLISIRETNDPPIAGDIDDVTVLEDAPNTLVSLFNAFSDPDDTDDALTFTVEGNTNAALFDALSIDPTTGNLSLDYKANANGSSTITVQAMDPGGLTAQTSFKTTVTPVNDPPSMTPGDDITLDEDPGPQSYANWATNISPGPQDEASQTVTASVSNTNPALFSSQPKFEINGANGTLSFTPAPETGGQATVTITLSDNGGIQGGGVNVASYDVVITVRGDNDPPSSIGIADIQPLEDAASVTYNLFDIFSDVEDPDASLTFSLPNGFDEDLFSSVTISGSPAILTVDFADDAFGTAVIAVRATDTGGLWAQEEFEVDVLPVNDAPVFTAGADVALPQNSPPQTIENWATGMSAGASNEADQTLQFSVTNDNETLFGEQPSIGPAGTLTFAPAIGEQVFGDAVVTVILADNGGTENGGIDQSAPATFTISIRRFNTAPTANDDNYIVEQGGTLTVNAAIGVLANDDDPENDPLTARLIAPPVNAAAFALNADGSFSYRHNNTATTNDVFTYVTNDGFDDSEVATATISIQPLGSLVLADIVVQEDAPDTELDVRAAMGLSPGAGHWFALTSNSNRSLFDAAEIDSLSGLLLLSYAANKSGSANLTIVATPPMGDPITATQRVEIRPLNDPPIAVDDVAATIANRPIEIDVLSNDVDFDNDALIIRTFSNPTVGAVEPQFNGRFLYTPPQDFTGQDSFTYTISDDSLATDMGRVVITIFSGRFVVTDLGLPGSTNSAAYNISNVGEAVGAVRTSAGLVKAFSTERAFFDDVPSEALDANDFGQVVGAMAVPLKGQAGSTFHAARWDSTGALDLGALDGVASTAYSINNEGQIVGVSTHAQSDHPRAFLWEAGELTALESEISVPSQAFSINERGQSAGYAGSSAIVWNGERIQRRLAGSDGKAYNLNDRGQVVGSINNGNVQAVFWEDDGAQRTLDVDDSPFSEAYGINNATWIVGAYRVAGAGKTSGSPALRKADRLRAAFLPASSTTTAGKDSPAPEALFGAAEDMRAFLWQGDAMVDLNDFIDAGSGWTLLEARAINNAAQIAGVGLFNGQQRAFLLSPTNNKTPTAVDDRVQLSFIAPLTFSVLDNDTDEDGDTLRVISVTQGAAGEVHISGTNQITYSPSSEFDGRDTFTYTVDDGHGGRAVGKVVVAMDESALPASYRLDQNYPNPFNPTTTIVFGLPEKAHVRLDVYNMLGQRVETLIDATRPAGAHTVEFDAGRLPGGTYMYRLSAEGFSESRKMILLK